MSSSSSSTSISINPSSTSKSNNNPNNNHQAALITNKLTSLSSSSSSSISSVLSTEPFMIQWYKDGSKNPIYIFYENFDPTYGEGFEGRVSLVDKNTQASLNLSNIKDSDQGWYECKVFYLMRENNDDDPNKNRTRILLEVNSPPHFKEKPPEAVFVKTSDSLTLHCRAHGTPTPTVLWQKDNSLVQNSASIRVHGGELILKSIQKEDTGTYVCIAKNRQGSISANTQVLISSPAEIVNPPRNTTVLENNRVEMSCGARGTPSNITYRWYHKGILISQLPKLAHRTKIKSDGTLVILSAEPDDSGKLTCDATNGIGEPDTASAHLSVEFPARVTYSPARQYLPLGMSGIVRCYIQASPQLQFATWTKDHRMFDPTTLPNVELLSNGSLLFHKVSQEHHGFYRCTPYNLQGTGQSSNSMEVIVREPPMFKISPQEYYVASLDDDVTMSCEGMGQPKPKISWRRVGSNGKMPKHSFQRNGNITLVKLRKEDFGRYECVIENEIATLIASTEIRMNGTTPYAPNNLTINTSAYAATLMWQPNFDGGLRQHFTIRYRLSQDDDSGWKTMRVQPSDSKVFSLYNLQPDQEYEFQVFATNSLGRGPGSDVIKARTKKKPDVELSLQNIVSQTDQQDITTSNIIRTLDIPTVIPESLSSSSSIKSSTKSTNHINNDDNNDNNHSIITSGSGGSSGNSGGLSPGSPRNVSIEKMAQGWVVSWLPPKHPQPTPVAYYSVEYREGDGDWTMSEQISQDNAYLIKELKTSIKYTIRVWAFSILGIGSSSSMIEYKITNTSGNMKGSRAITAGVVGSVLFFVAAIILSVCAVKICNKRKQRKMEKAYMMVTCPVMDGVNGTHSHHGSPVTLKQ
uniref:Protein turtle-like n=1 Tax=Dermatophagoides pteronyssinus TaxID=6956 RepID=A0A6P6YJA7_DERPT|nr:protein turtle-like [Dermatophagoides pteronyssinus]